MGYVKDENNFKNTFFFISSDPEVVFLLYFRCHDPALYVFSLMPMFSKEHTNMSFHGNQIENI